MSECSFSNSVENELRENGVYASVTKGTSMQPLFKTNRDMIILRKPSAELKKYDVVLYRTNAGKYVLHRIVKVTSKQYIIRGDNTYVLEYVDKDRIIAVLSEFNRKGKKRSVDAISYRIYSRVWNFIYPIRWMYVKLRSFAASIYRKLFKKSKEQE